MKGIYCLQLKCSKKYTIEIGKLGTFQFEPGYYHYIGSAMNSLEKRTARYFSKIDNHHWHIDHLLKKAIPVTIVKIKTEKRLECKFNNVFQEYFNTTAPIKKFGSSDCNCFSHLHFTKNNILPFMVKEAVYEKLDSDLCVCK